MAESFGVFLITGLANRRYFDEQLDFLWGEAVNNQGELSMIMLDFDYFKNFNDFYGHQAGDDCLKLVTNEIDIHLSQEDVVFARYGGEEFAMILPHFSEGKSYELALEIQKLVEQLQIYMKFLRFLNM
nr:diguanylate cyclase [Salipaludibacillus daqingensis]